MYRPLPLGLGKPALTLWTLTGGFVLSEAMGCGTPIIGSRSGVISECVVEGQTGLLATPKNAASFADAIEKLARDESLRKTMRVNSRERMLSGFKTDINVDNTLRIYASLDSKAHADQKRQATRC